MLSDPKSVQFVMRLSPLEKKMLEDLARSTGRAGADILRTALRAAYEARFGDKRPVASRRH